MPSAARSFSRQCRVARRGVDLLGVALLGLGWIAAPLVGQAPLRSESTARALAWPAPAPGRPTGEITLAVGRDLLERHDPVGALAVFRQLRIEAPAPLEPRLGLARCHLDLGAADLALRYVAEGPPNHVERLAIEVRALLRAREFDAALAVAERAMGSPGARSSAELLAAHASALFRQQRNDEAAALYQRVLRLDATHVEAHIRLGSGLQPPGTWDVPARLELGVAHARAGAHADAIRAYAAVLAAAPGHPIAHRLLGEALLAQRWVGSMPAMSPEFAQLEVLTPVPVLDAALAEQFLPGFGALSPSRRRAALRALGLFAGYLPRLVAIGGRHDLLAETERTTDAAARSALRGRRTFDGRVWDDVRGMGGLRAATGIESLDEALQFGFDTLAHEVAHQAHLYGFSQVNRQRLRALYQKAKAEDRFLDYYAASNEAEYFGQGVEAFASLAKAPGQETTHGHTRFELLRVDPALHDFIAGVSDWDPLRDVALREPLLVAAAEVALRCGRWADAVTAVRLLTGQARARLGPRVERAALVGTPH